MQKDNRDFQFDIEQLRHLYIVAKDKNHKFEMDRNEWTLFEPSKFIYNYFAFNTFYNIDWPKSIENQRIIEHGSLSEKGKIENLINFIFQTQPEPAISKVFLDGKRPIITDNVLRECLNITVDRNGPNKNVSFTKKEEFIRRLTDWKQNRIIAFDDYFQIVCFIYLVRNNIFHGSKTFEDMISLSQRARLDFYAKILSATNRLLFQSIASSQRQTEN